MAAQAILASLLVFEHKTPGSKTTRTVKLQNMLRDIHKTGNIASLQNELKVEESSCI